MAAKSAPTLYNELQIAASICLPGYEFAIDTPLSAETKDKLCSLSVANNAQENAQIWIGAMDEVGRGSLAGPVSVGIAVMSLPEILAAQIPPGLTDSKLLTPKKRGELYQTALNWAHVEVGSASAKEIDTYGITGGLRLAARRALKQLVAQNRHPQALLLDGSSNWFKLPPPDIFAAPLPDEIAQILDFDAALPVRTLVKGDQRCALISAASVVAKVQRDDYMRQLAADFPAYHWGSCKGYASPAHQAALVKFGPTEHHRISWNLPKYTGKS